MAVRTIYCIQCRQEREFRQRRVARLKHQPGFRRRWFRCPVCRIEKKVIEADDGWVLPPATLFQM